MAATEEDRPQQGLVAKYHVQKIEDLSGKHDNCPYFVLDPVHDPLARPVMVLYAQLAELEGKQELARDIGNLLDRVTLMRAAEESRETMRKLMRLDASNQTEEHNTAMRDEAMADRDDWLSKHDLSAPPGPGEW